MKSWILIAALAAAAPAEAAKLETGKPAPAFTLPDAEGKEHSLADHKGKYVVLEWFNDGCPYVRKHYDSGNMQALQERYAKKGVVWYSIVSSAPGTQGHCTPERAKEQMKKEKSNAAALLLDPEGAVGRAYDAKTTPHMYVVDPKGVLIYQGGIDSIRSTDPEDIAEAKPYVADALDAALAGKPVPEHTTTPYGCSVKYGKKGGRKKGKGKEKKERSKKKDL